MEYAGKGQAGANRAGTFIKVGGRGFPWKSQLIHNTVEYGHGSRLRIEVVGKGILD